MIELELKFELSKIPTVLEELEKKGEKSQKDIYYDTDKYNLIINGNFLRCRNNKILEFKLGEQDDAHLFCKEVEFNLDEADDKIDTIMSIFKHNGIDISATNVKELLNNLSVLATIEKERNEYIFNQNCTIAIDKVKDLGTFLEAEIMIDKDELDLQEAEEIKEKLLEELYSASILSKADKRINVGYVELYLYKYNKEAYELGKFKIV